MRLELRGTDTNAADAAAGEGHVRAVRELLVQLHVAREHGRAGRVTPVTGVLVVLGNSKFVCKRYVLARIWSFELQRILHFPLAPQSAIMDG